MSHALKNMFLNNSVSWNKSQTTSDILQCTFPGDGTARYWKPGSASGWVPSCKRAGQQRAPRGAHQTLRWSPAWGGSLQPQPELRGAQWSRAGGASEKQQQLTLAGQSSCYEFSGNTQLKIQNWIACVHVQPHHSHLYIHAKIKRYISWCKHTCERMRLPGPTPQTVAWAPAPCKWAGVCSWPQWFHINVVLCEKRARQGKLMVLFNIAELKIHTHTLQRMKRCQGAPCLLFSPSLFPICKISETWANTHT